MSGPSAISYVPEEFWTKALEKALGDSLDEFRQHEDVIAKEQYLDDFMSCLVSFGIRGTGSESFVEKVNGLVQENVAFMGPKASENCLFFVDRSSSKDVTSLKGFQMNT